MKDQVNAALSVVLKFGVLAVVLITPLFFWNVTSEFYETPKFLAVEILTLLLLVLWSLKFLVERRVKITRTPLDIPLLLLLGVILISTFFTVSWKVSVFGNLPRLHGSTTAWITYILFYFILVSNLRTARDVRHIINTLLAGGLIVSVISLLAYFGVYLPIAWTQVLNFTPTGSSFSTAAFLALMVPFLLQNILRSTPTAKIVSAVILTLFGVTIALIGPLATQVVALVAVGIALMMTSQAQLKNKAPLLLIPLVISVLLFAASAFSMNKNPLYTKAQNFPRELQLPAAQSWKVSISAFRDSPIWGTGPATYMSDFTAYKPVEFNSEKFWTVRFDQGFNEYLQILATLGGAGLLSFLLLTFVFISSAYKKLSSEQQEFLSTPLAISGIMFFLLLALHPSTLVLWVVGVIILAGYMVVHKDITEEIHLAIAAIRSYSNQLRFDLLPVVILLVVLLLSGTALFFTGQYALADVYHRQALNAVSSNNGLDAYNNLVKAENYNPHVDVYRSNLAQTNFALANAIAAAKGPSEASPAGSLTDADKQNIQVFLSQAINEGRNAIALNPQNPANWEILGSIYRQIAGVAQNALSFSLDAYGQAIQRDPLNPLLRLTTGGIYYSVKNYDLAIRFFSDAVQLKPDFANGWFNLSIALRDKGDITSAVAAAQKTVSLIDAKSPDYEAASKLLADLQAVAASQAAEQQKQEAAAQTQNGGNLQQASQTNSALNQKNLPQVLDLPKPESISTPAAVQKP